MRATHSFFNQDTAVEFSDDEEPLRRPPLHRSMIKRNMIPLQMLGRFHEPPTIFPLEEPQHIPEVAFSALGKRVNDLVGRGYLSAQEGEILKLLIDGKKLRKIAATLGIKRAAVKMIVTQTIPVIQTGKRRTYLQ